MLKLYLKLEETTEVDKVKTKDKAKTTVKVRITATRIKVKVKVKMVKMVRIKDRTVRTTMEVAATKQPFKVTSNRLHQIRMEILPAVKLPQQQTPIISSISVPERLLPMELNLLVAHATVFVS